MRIIDKNRDFYDYCQGLYPDDAVTFDRRDSYALSKQEFAGRLCLRAMRSNNRHKFGYVLLQVCNTFWLFRLEAKNFDDWDFVTDYTIDLLHSWKDYNFKRARMKLSQISFGYRTMWEIDKRHGEQMVDELVNSIEHNDFTYERVFDNFVFYKGKVSSDSEEVRHIPILKDIGIAKDIDPVEIYFALDEYFSQEKTSNERTESVGITDMEKVVNHGFDPKGSFRGKRKP